VQIAHHVYCYYQVCGEVGNVVEISIPTGACGNITGEECGINVQGYNI
jgi:hypothetical protein